MAIFEFIHIDEFSSTPKYRQLAHSIIEAIQKNKLKIDLEAWMKRTNDPRAIDPNTNLWDKYPYY